MSFSIVRQNITKMHVDAIVNAANTDLLMGGGVCGAIFSAAGADQMQEACDRVAPIHTGEAAITPAFRLPAKYVIHAAGPDMRFRTAGNLMSSWNILSSITTTTSTGSMKCCSIMTSRFSGAIKASNPVIILMTPVSFTLF